MRIVVIVVIAPQIKHTQPINAVGIEFIFLREHVQ